MTIRNIQRLTCGTLIAATIGLAGTAAQADLLVYEGFQYGPAGSDQVTDTNDPNYNLLHLQPDGVGGDVDATGLSGTWQDSVGPGDATSLFMSAGSLSFSNLPTSGNHVRSDTNQNNDVFSRTVTADLDQSNEMWFSFLANKLQNNFSAAEGGVAITNQTVGNSRIFENTGADGLIGFGIAPTTSGNDWTFYAWDGSSRSNGDATFGVPTNGSETNLLVGHVTFNSGVGGADEFRFFYATDDGDLSTTDLVQVGSTLSIDLDETTLDTLNVTRQVNTAYDEIRITTTGDEAVGIPEPASVALLGLGGLMLFRRR